MYAKWTKWPYTPGRWCVLLVLAKTNLQVYVQFLFICDMRFTCIFYQPAGLIFLLIFFGVIRKTYIYFDMNIVLVGTCVQCCIVPSRLCMYSLLVILVRSLKCSFLMSLLVPLTFYFYFYCIGEVSL